MPRHIGRLTVSIVARAKVRVLMLCAIVSLLYALPSYAERRFLEHSPLTEAYANAVRYRVPASSAEKMDALRNPLARPGATPVLSYDEVADQYTYWYNGEQGRREAKSFFLANRAQVEVTARVELKGDRFSYHYTVRVLPRAPPEPLLSLILEVHPHLIESLDISDKWIHTPIPERGLMSFFHQGLFENMTVEEMKKLNVNTFSFDSAHGPRLVHIAGQSLPDTIPIQDDRYALGLRGNSMVGVTIGPADAPLDNVYVLLDELLSEAEKWQWLSQPTISDMRKKMDEHSAGKVTLAERLSQLQKLSNAPEVSAMLREVARNL